MGGLILPDGNFGIKEQRIIRILHSKSFQECGLFCHTIRKKGYVKGRGIVEIIAEVTVLFADGIPATPENYGGSCCLGTIVSKKSLVPCSEPGCGEMVCLVETCKCGGRREDKIYCMYHIYPGLIGVVRRVKRLMR